VSLTRLVWAYGAKRELRSVLLTWNGRLAWDLTLCWSLKPMWRRSGLKRSYNRIRKRCLTERRSSSICFGGFLIRHVLDSRQVCLWTFLSLFMKTLIEFHT
jgi:hypothetical protein